VSEEKTTEAAKRNGTPKETEKSDIKICWRRNYTQKGHRIYLSLLSLLLSITPLYAFFISFIFRSYDDIVCDWKSESKDWTIAQAREQIVNEQSFTRPQSIWWRDDDKEEEEENYIN